MGALHVSEQLVADPEESRAAESRFDPGSWGLLLIPVLTGIGLCVAMLFVG